MIVRFAFFEGEILPGAEAQFEAFVTDQLMPLWQRFPGALSVRVVRGTDGDEGAPSYPLVLAITYRSRAALEEALASDVRAESRRVTQGLYAFFRGRIFHVNGPLIATADTG